MPSGNEALLLAAPVTSTITGAISPAHSIGGPVGGEHMDGSSADHATATEHSMHAHDSSAPADLAFIDQMTVHHQAALDMAQELLANTDRPELLALANTILTTQAAEIAQMQAWRAAWYPDAPPSATGAAPEMSMGQMSVSEDSSIPYARRFLEAMISHHAGALEMAEMALQQTQRPEIKPLAEAMIGAQAAEIAQMQAWLNAWYGE